MNQTSVPKVLIVDDQPRNLDALEAMLQPIECIGVRAQSADEALLCLLRHEFAAIILDIRMPGMNGIELAKLIKQRKRSTHVPILFLTAHMLDDDDALQGYGVGGVDYLSKPINPEILRSKIGVFIDLFTKTRALAERNDAWEAEVTERGRVVADADRNPVRVVGISRDVTAEREAAHERERLLQDARQARDEAEQQSRLKDEFLATLSHELRTPMNVILGWLAIMDGGKPIRNVPSAVSVIRRNAELQARLIEDLLDMNR